MNLDAGSKVADNWWEGYKKEQSVIKLISLIGLFTAMLILNPTFHETFEVIVALFKRVVSPSAANSGEGVVFVFMMVPIVLMIFIYTPWSLSALIGAIASTNKELNYNWLPKRISKAEINYSVLPAYKIRAKREIKLFQTFKKSQNFYQIAESKKYVADTYLLRASFKTRFVVLLLAACAMNAVFGYINSGSNSPYLFLFALTTVVGLFFLEILISVFLSYKEGQAINKAVIESPDSGDQVWAEYHFTFSLTTSAYSYGDIAIQGTSLEKLKWSAMLSYPALEDLLEHLKDVSNQAYLAMDTINDIKSGGATRVDNSFHTQNIEQLKRVVDIFVPTCIKEILNDIKHSPDSDSFGLSYYKPLRNIKVSEAHLYDESYNEEEDLVDLYDIIYRDIRSRKVIISKIQTYYNQIINMITVSGIVDDIKNQAETNDNVEGYSLKTAVLNQKLNHIIIPQLKAMLIGSDDETAVKINEKIKEVSKFFNEQVALEEQLQSSNMLEYDRAVEIEGNLNLIPIKNGVDTYLTNLDYYLKELDKNW